MKTTTLNTLEEVRSVFQAQIDKTEPCTCDWLAGRTIEEAVEKLLNLPVEPGFEALKRPTTSESARELVENKIKEWTDHKGQRMLYVVTRTANDEGKPSVNVRSMYESQLDELVGKMYESTTETGLPIFVEPEWLDAIESSLVGQ